MILVKLNILVLFFLLSNISKIRNNKKIRKKYNPITLVEVNIAIDKQQKIKLLFFFFFKYLNTKYKEIVKNDKNIISLLLKKL